MADEVAKIDLNYKGVMLAVTNDGNKFITLVRVDPTTLRLLVDATAVITPPRELGNGAKTVASAGTAVALAAATTISKVIIRANEGNSGKIYVGGSSVSSTSGAWLLPTESMELEIDDLAEVYIDADSDGDGVQFTYTIA